MCVPTPPMRRLRCAAATVALAACIPLTPALAGPLDPPPGPVGPTHKTLTQVEPRTPLSLPPVPPSVLAHIVIDQPGSYYLTGNIVTSDRAAILITANDVTIDLNGFNIRGTNAPDVSAIIGSSSFIENVAIVNGSISDFRGGSAIVLSADSARYENLRIRRCFNGILNVGGFAGICRGNSFYAIESRSIAMGDASLVADNELRYLVTASGTDPAITGGVATRIVGNSIHSPPARGILISAASVVEGNTVNAPGSDGIVGQTHGRIVGNTVRGAGRENPTSAGISVILSAGCTIEDNTVGASPVGIRTLGGSIVVRNRLHGNTTAIQSAATDAVGPIVTPATMAGGTNALANVVN